MSNNAELTKQKILVEAEREFAKKGPYASSINVISERSTINKRMIYHYYHSKEELYKEVLRMNFNKIKIIVGEKVCINQNDLIACIKQLIKDYYYFLRDNENYVKIMAWEETSGAEVAKNVIPDTFLIIYDRLQDIYYEGVKQGIFKEQIDLNQLVISVSGLCFFTFARKEVLYNLWVDDLETKLNERLEHIYSLILNTLCI
ncbi:transcriptional regulator, TetR family [Desulfonispora thiosulfatigenes DSM 11270]|uniref:Transcriptional regulator, TetR family n=1 Tax=Desulfonispora thiosulfatigenes DSM 11270 TaxID=656914 RepID=A0A1W1UU61_DESTI|nr:TetR/AcrR family transcriptional regulator [Desulfonispora thiosulfatigenes]SMB84675.1 transcriptional regulator, TetR family [Desulfonispora thiosulfatigenes DSM 11270]